MSRKIDNSVLKNPVIKSSRKKVHFTIYFNWRTKLKQKKVSKREDKF